VLRSYARRLWDHRHARKEEAPRSRPRLPLKAAPEGAVETDYGLTSPGKICRVYGYRRVNFRGL